MLERCGLVILPALVGAEQLGVPVPAAPVLIGFGALAATGRVNIPLALGVIALVALSVDFGWYELGRRRGAGILAGLSRVSLEPHSCMRQAHNVFARCGVSTLLAAKFVPGVTVVVALLAGRVAVSRVRFLLYDIAGLWLWAGCGIGSCGVPRPSLAPYVTVTGPRKRRSPPEAMDLRETRPILRFPLYSRIDSQ